MKTLFLMRHAKSTWQNPAADDHARELNGRGLAAASAMGVHLAALLAAHEVALDLAYCSSAKRARQTWSLAAAELALSPREKILSELYLCGPDGVLTQIRKVDEAANCLLIVAHNPDLQILVNLLAASGDAKLRREARSHFPSDTLAGLEFNCARWTEIGAGGGALFAFATPKGLSQPGLVANH